MGRKELESLVGKIRSMYLTVPGVVVHLYHLQRALAQGGGRQDLDISGFSLINWVLEDYSCTDSGSTHSPG